LIDEEDVIGGAGVGGIFANGDAGADGEVDFLFVLHDPTRSGEQTVDAVAGGLFGVLVWRRRGRLKRRKEERSGRPFDLRVTMRLM
jgi:hypothetical protein